MSALADVGEVIVAEVEGQIVGAVAYVGPGVPKAEFFRSEWPIMRMVTVHSPRLAGAGRGESGRLCPFYIGAAQFEYWQHTQLIIDVVPGRGGMFSLEGPEGKRFLTRSRLYSDEEWAIIRIL